MGRSLTVDIVFGMPLEPETEPPDDDDGSSYKDFFSCGIDGYTNYVCGISVHDRIYWGPEKLDVGKLMALKWDDLTEQVRKLCEKNKVDFDIKEVGLYVCPNYW